MTFYLQAYPYRRMARRWAENRNQTLGVNVREENEAYILSALVPGISADELNIQVLEDVVHIKAEYKVEEKDNYLVHELPTGSLTRTLRLPAPIDADHVEADVTNGVLTLRLPKAESARPKQIKIKTN
ncbi:MAG TPA: Hsp20/alpha crystallin family protein [Anaerolineales bacterium]|nr:Hsp20/alpha crystallin family protein [Anaerolineales bacterium]